MYWVQSINVIKSLLLFCTSSAMTTVTAMTMVAHYTSTQKAIVYA